MKSEFVRTTNNTKVIVDNNLRVKQYLSIPMFDAYPTADDLNDNDPAFPAIGIYDGSLLLWDNTAWIAAGGGLDADDIGFGLTIGTDGKLKVDQSVYLTSAQNDLRYAAISHTHQISDVIGLQTSLDSKLNLSGGQMTGDLLLASDPINGNSAVRKAYVDNLFTGLTWKQEVRAGTTANITLSGTQTVDGVALVANNRVLVKNQTDATQNGIYIVQSGAWVRSADADSTFEISTAAVFIRLGTTNKDTQWTNSNSNDPVIGTDAITFAQISGAGTYTNGTGINLTANVFSLNKTYTDTLYQPLTDQLLNKANSVEHKSLAITGTAGAGYVSLASQTSIPATPTTGSLIYADTTGRLSWLSPLGFSRTFSSSTLTASRVYNFQDKSYTLADDADVVHRLGTIAEDITGVKTFIGDSPSFGIKSNSDGNAAYFTRIAYQNTFALTNATNVAGGLSSALSYNGTSSYTILQNTNVPTGNSDFTVQMWVKTTQSTIYACLMQLGTYTASGNQYLTIALRNGIPHLRSNTTAILTIGSGSIANNTWKNIAVSKTGNTIVVYVNGSQVGTVSTPLNLTTEAPSISRENAITSFYNGLIDQVLIYNVGLTAAQVQANIIYPANTGTPNPSTSGLVAHYPLDENSGTIINNIVTGGTATTTNTTWNANGKVSTASTVGTSNWLRNYNGQSNSDESTTEVGAYLGQTILTGRYLSGFINNTKVWSIDQLGRMSIMPEGVPDRMTNGSNQSFSNLYIGIGASTVSQLMLADSGVALTASSSTAGGIIRNGAHIYWSTGTALVQLDLSSTDTPTFAGLNLSTSDLVFALNSKGVVFVDRGDGTKKRITITNGVLGTEAA